METMEICIYLLMADKSVIIIVYKNTLNNLDSHIMESNIITALVVCTTLPFN